MIDQSLLRKLRAAAAESDTDPSLQRWLVYKVLREVGHSFRTIADATGDNYTQVRNGAQAHLPPKELAHLGPLRTVLYNHKPLDFDAVRERAQLETQLTRAKAWVEALEDALAALPTPA